MEQTSAAESLDIELPSGSLTSNAEKEENSASEQLSATGNLDSQLDPQVNLIRKNEDKNPNSSSVSSPCDSNGNPRSPSQVSTDQKKDSIQSVVENDQEQNKSNSQDNSTNFPGGSLATTSADENTNLNIDASLQPDSENKQIDGKDPAQSPNPLHEESGNILEKSPYVIEESGNVLEESGNVLGESGNVLEESDNVLEEFLTLKMPQETSLPDEEPGEQNVEDPNSHKTSSEYSEMNLSTNNEEVNTSYESASQLLFGNDDVGTSDKSSTNVGNEEKCINNDLVQPNNQQNDDISSQIAENSSVTTNVERDLCALFSDSDAVDDSESLKTKDENKCNEETDGSKVIGSDIGVSDFINSDALPTKTTSGNNTAEQDLCALFSGSDAADNSEKIIKDENECNEKTDGSKIMGSVIGGADPINSDVLPTQTTLPNDDTLEESFRHENNQIKDVNTDNENVCELKASLEDENSTANSVKDLNIAIDFNTNQIEIKEEIESIGYDNSNSLQGFDNDDGKFSYASDSDLQGSMIDLCRKKCFVKLERCDESLLNVANPYLSDMKIVSVQSLSCMNFTEKHNIVWSYFIEMPNSVECKICGRTLMNKKLSGLTRHLQNVHDHSFKKNIEQDAPSASHTPQSIKSKRSSANASSKLVNDPVAFKQKPMSYFSFVNSQTARCKLCSQYMPYRSLDDLGILKSHLLLKHSETACSVSSNRKKLTKANKTVSSHKSSDEEEEDEDDDDDDDDDDCEETSGQNVGKRKPRQRTWSHFTKLERGLAQCNDCLKCFSYSGGNLRTLTRHLKIAHNDQKLANQSRQKAVPPKKAQKAQVLKKKPNPQDTNKKPELTRRSLTGKEFLKHFSFLRSDNALCKKCNIKVPYINKNTKSLLNHYQQCDPQLDSSKKDVVLKKKGGRRKILMSDVEEDESIKDPDFVPSDFMDEPYPNKHKTQLMAAVELSPKENIDWNHFKKVNGSMVECVHCSKKLSFKTGDTWLLEQHLQLWHGKNALKKSKDDGCDASLDEIPLLFRLKNQPQPYTLGDCYYRKKLQYNVVEIGRYFRRLGDGKLLCKLCSKRLHGKETSTETLMSHILQEHVRKLFKPRLDEASTTETTQSPVSKTTPSQMKSIAAANPLSMQKAQAQSTPLRSAGTPRTAAAAAATAAAKSKLITLAKDNKIEQQLLLKSSFTLKYFIDFGSNRQQCKLCNRQFVGKKSSNIVLLSKHLHSNHLKNVVDDETQLSGGNEQRKAIINCTRRRIVNKFSKINSLKISCKMCLSHLQDDDFETMKAHLLKNHQNYLITILKEVKRIENYNSTDLRKTKRLLTICKKRTLKAKCSMCSREVCYRAGNTKHLLNHLLKHHKTSIGKISVSKLKVWKYFTKKNFAESKCEICFKFISSKIHCNHKVPKLFCLSTGLKLKPRKESTMLKLKPETESTELKVKDRSSSKKACFYFSALKQYNSECIFCSKSLKSANKIICKIACRFNHGNEYINWLYKNDPVDNTFIPANQSDKTVQKTLSLLEMFEELKNKKINSIKLWYSEFSNKYHCNLCSDNISEKYLRFCLYFDHALEKHKGLLSMHRVVERPLDQLSGGLQPGKSVMDNMKSTTNSLMPRTPLKNTKLVKVKLWHHFKVIGAEIACCNFCKTKFRYTSTNVDNLSTHLRAAHLNDLLKLSEPAAKSSPTPTPSRLPLPPTLPLSSLTTTTANTTNTATNNNNNDDVKKSGTWKYFTESNRGAKCKLCGKQFLFSQKTHVTPLTKHLQTAHNITPVQEGLFLKKPLPDVLIQPGTSKEQQTKWAWQYFEKDDVRPLTAKCKLCSIYCSCTAEEDDLPSTLLKHLRLVHNKWLVNVGDNIQNNQGAKRQADTDLAASSPVNQGQGQKRVKFNDSINDDANSDNNTTEQPTTTPTPTPTLTPKKSLTPSKNSKLVSGQKAAPKAKKSLKRIQELEKSKTKKSLVWTYFTPIDGQPDFSRCNVCSKSISSKFGISILRTHLRVKHNILIVNMNQYSELKKSIGDTSLTNDLLTGGPSTKTNTALSPGEKQVVSPGKANSNDPNLNSSTLSNKSASSKLDKSHPVWSYFKEEKNSNLLKCNLCSVYLSCKSERAEGLQNHLSAKHNIVFLEADPMKNVTKMSADKITSNKSSPVKKLSTNETVEKDGKEEEPVAKPQEQTSTTAKELYETANVEESIVENEVFYTTEDNLVTIAERGDPSADETVHYEIVETTQHTEVESTDIVKVITELLPNYSVGISDDVNATEISPQESDLISNIVTSLSNPGDQVSTQHTIIDDEQLKSIAVLTGETEDTSLAWDFYVKLADNKVKCDVCSEVFTYENKDAANLTEHIQSKHPAELAQYKLSRLGFNDSCVIVVRNAD